MFDSGAGSSFIHDAVVAIPWLVVTVLLLGGNWRLIQRFAPEDPAGVAVLHTVLLSWSTIVVVAFALGTSGLLTPWAFLFCVGLIASHLCWCIGSFPSSRPIDVFGLNLWAGLAALWFGHIVYRGLLTFPVHGDCLLYHIPLIDQWLQAASLYAPREGYWYYPGNCEVIGLWLVAPFTGDFLIGLNNIPTLTVLVLAGFHLAMQLGMNKTVALCFTVILANNRIVWRQMTTSANDVTVLALCFASIYYAFRWGQSGKRFYLVLGAIALGLLLGTKYLAMHYTAICWLLLCVNSGWRRKRYGTILYEFGSIVGLVALTGGYWYVRNWVVTGSPLYPKGFGTAPDVMRQVPTWSKGIWLTTLLGTNFEGVWQKITAAALRWTGPYFVFAAVSVPLSWVWLSRWLSGKCFIPILQHEKRRQIAFCVCACLCAWVTTPWAARFPIQLENGYQPIRFGLPFLGLAGLSFAALYCDYANAVHACWPSYIARMRVARACVSLTWLVPAAAVFFSAWHLSVQWFGLFEPEVDLMDEVPLEGLLEGLNVLLCGTILFASGALAAIFANRWLLRCVVVVVGFLIVIAIGGLSEHWHSGFVVFYETRRIDRVMSELRKQTESFRQVCVLDTVYYPFLGSHREFEIARPLWFLEYQDFVIYLRLHGIRKLVAVNVDKSNTRFYEPVLEWVKARPDTFERIYEGRLYSIFDVKSDHLK
jgi:hypothetical protein